MLPVNLLCSLMLFLDSILLQNESPNSVPMDTNIYNKYQPFIDGNNVLKLGSCKACGGHVSLPIFIKARTVASL